MEHKTEIKGVEYLQTSFGQKRAYGDSFYEYKIESQIPADEVEKVCTQDIRKCSLTAEQYKKENRENSSMGNYFRSSYTFKNLGDGRYFYSVTYPYTD